MSFNVSSYIASSGELPVTPFAGKTPSHYLFDSELDQCVGGKHNPAYRLEDIEYRFNAHGYRCHEFSEQGDLTLLSIGCSYVFGTGLKQAEVFPEYVASDIIAARHIKVVHWNLALPARSNDYIARMLAGALPILCPDIVLVNFTFACRREYIAPTGQELCYVPSYTPAWSKELSDAWHHRSMLASVHDDAFNLTLNYSIVEELLAGKRWLFSFVDNQDLALIAPAIDRERFVGVLNDPGLVNPTLARDLLHAGKTFHRALADRYYRRLLQSRWV